MNRAQAQINVGAYSLALGRIDEASDAARDALAAAHRTGEPMIASASFQHLAGVAAEREDTRHAARLMGASDAQRAYDQPRLFTEQTGYDQTMKKLRQEFSDTELGSLMREGHAWGIDDAIERAMTMGSNSALNARFFGTLCHHGSITS